MYLAQWINPLKQFNSETWTLLLKDDAGVMADRRFDGLQFKHTPVTNDEKKIVADEKIAKAIEEWDNREL
jgi:hypothetical protein